jgi:hypothetical protein
VLKFPFSGVTPITTQRDGTNPVTFPFAGLYSQVTTNSAGVVTGYRSLAQPSNKDKMAWLIGLKIGDNKKAGDLSVYGDFRQVGIASIDPNDVVSTRSQPLLKPTPRARSPTLLGITINSTLGT